MGKNPLREFTPINVEDSFQLTAHAGLKFRGALQGAVQGLRNFNLNDRP